MTDSKDSPINGAVVYIKNAKTLQIRSFITKEQGAYYFHSLSTDIDYELHADGQYCDQRLGPDKNGVPKFNQNPERVLGPPSAKATPEIPDNEGVYSFGWGGSVTVSFDRPSGSLPTSRPVAICSKR